MNIKKNNKLMHGEITIGATTLGQVFIITPSPEIIFTPEQARNAAKLLLARADEADNTLRRAAN